MKKILSLILAGSMLFSLAACGDSSKDKDDDKKNTSDIVEDSGDVAGENNGFVAEEDDTQVGDYITFGSYEQDNDLSNGKEPIEWLVLDKQDGKMLVISNYALDCQPYNATYEEVTWETCTLRSWLNDEFINEAFTSSKRAKIPTVTVTAEANPSYGTNPGNATQDKVFLLSIDEANDYFASSDARQCKATDYAIAQGLWVSDSAEYAGNCWWWLRSPGKDQCNPAGVAQGGDVSVTGYFVCHDLNAVRPAMWIEL